MFYVAEPKIPELRGVDAWGSGAFGASRGSKKHRGVDFKAQPGAIIFSGVEGVVTNIGLPYGDVKKRNYRYVEVTDNQENQHRYFYVLPFRNIKVGASVSIMQPLGIAQDIAKHYSKMINHIHYEIKRDGRYLDPLIPHGE